MRVVHISACVVLLVALAKADSQESRVTIHLTGPVKIVIGSSQEGHEAALQCSGGSGAPVKQGCPEGFFTAGGSSQCFKLINDKKRTWEEAKNKCATEGLQLAEPKDEDAFALRNHLLDTYGGLSTWLGARGDGKELVWQSNNLAGPSEDSPLFHKSYGPAYPPGVVNTYICLGLSTHQNSLEHPYVGANCETNKYYTLCQVSV